LWRLTVNYRKPYPFNLRLLKQLLFVREHKITAFRTQGKR
jgi:hypothetical protein